MKPVCLAVIALCVSLVASAAPPPEVISLSATAYELPVSTNAKASKVTVVRTGGTGSAFSTTLQVQFNGATLNLPVNFAAGAATAEVEIRIYSPTNGSLTLLPPAPGIEVAPFANATLKMLSIDALAERDVYVGVFDSAAQRQNLSGLVIIAVNANGSFTAQVSTALFRKSLRGAFGIGNHAVVVNNNLEGIQLQLELQRFWGDDGNQLSGTCFAGHVLGAMPITFARALRRTELASLPADRIFTGALRSADGPRSLAAPTHLRLNRTGRWSLLGRTRDRQAFTASFPALAGNRVCFADVRRPFPQRTRTALLTYDPANHLLTGDVQVCEFPNDAYYYLESGPLAVYVAPLKNQLPGVFAGAPPIAGRFLSTDAGNTATTQTFTWMPPAGVQLTGSTTTRFRLNFQRLTGLLSGKFSTAGVTKPTPFSAAFISGTNTADDGTFVGTAKPDANVRLIQITGP